MIRNFFFLKAFSIFLLINILFNTMWPTLCLAVTTGPYQVDHTGFESFDNTDMVNLITGDLTYNIPLVSIPCPEGDFPLSLTYRAGIGVEQEASWVGLGWSMTPGSITRNVSQFPDDFSGEVLKTDVNHAGGDQYSINVLGVYTKTVSHFLGQETGNGGTIGLLGLVDFGWGDNSGFTNVLGVHFTEDGVKVDLVGVISAGLTIASLGTAGSLTGAVAGQIAGMGIGLGIQALMSVGGTQKISKNDWTIESKVGIFKSSMKYYLDVSKSENMYGLLYYHKLNTITAGVVNRNEVKKTYVWNNTNNGACGQANNKQVKMLCTDAVSDMYMKDVPGQPEFGVITNPTHLTYDQYNIAGQGLSGQIHPYREEVGSLFFNKSVIECPDNLPLSSGDVKLYLKMLPVPYLDYKVKFKYHGDNNYYRHHLGNNASGTLSGPQMGIEVSLPQNCPEYPQTNYLLKDNTLYDASKRKESSREGYINQKLAHRKNIEWYSNAEISSGIAIGENFIDFKSGVGGTSSARHQFRASLPQNGIGGFSVTKEDGSTYHYSIPVYNNGQIIYSETSPGVYNFSKMNASYAHTWLLTAITGADFIDRNELGVINDDDWGYWVKFDYGKFANSFKWKEPYMNDLVYSEGMKETYYLNTIRTRSHTAMFVKDVRTDGKAHFKKGAIQTGNFIYDEAKPSVSLKLNTIAILPNKEYDALGINMQAGTLPGVLRTYTDAQISDSHQSVIDISDISNSQWTAIDNNCIKRVDFTFDYTLCPNTINSFISQPASFPAATADLKGKLTLKKFSVSRKGILNKLFPDFTFEYHDPSVAYGQSNADMWGMNKYTTATSGNAWSLKKVTTPIGGTIQFNYERDTYSSNLNKPLPTNYTIYLSEFGQPSNTISSSVPLSEYFSVGDEFLIDYNVLNYSGPNCTTNGILTGSYQATVAIGEFLSPYTFKIAQYEFRGIFGVDAMKPPLYGCDAGYTILNQYTITPKIPKTKIGGDLRVKDIEVSDGINSYKTEYQYLNSSNHSSGYVSMEPTDESPNYDYPRSPVLYGTVTVNSGKTTTSSTFTNSTEYNFYTPTSARDIIDDSESGMVDEQDFATHRIGNTQCYGHYKLYKGVIKDLTAKLGTIKSIRYKDKTGVFYKSADFYYNETPMENGLYTEGSILCDLSLMYGNTAQYLYELDVQRYNKMIRTTKTRYAYNLTTVFTKQDGVSSTSNNIAWDLISGEVIKKEFTNSLGTKFISESVPAYTLTPYASMGSKAININNKNLLSAKAGNYLYKTSVSNSNLISAEVQTWANNWFVRGYNNDIFSTTTSNNVWRPKAKYVWKSPELNNDGTFKNFVTFNYSGTPDDKWLKINEITQYDQYSKALEIKDVNGNFSSVRYGHDKKYPLYNVQNSSYLNSTYTGFESTDPSASFNYFDGEFSAGNQRRDLSGTNADVPNYIKPHTGNSIARLPSGAGDVFGPTYFGMKYDGTSSGLQRGRKYRASVWIHQSSDPKIKLVCSLQGTSGGNTNYMLAVSKNMTDAVATVNGWKLVYVDISVPSDYTSASSSSDNSKDMRVYIENSQSTTAAYVDDMRIHPFEATMAATVYDDKTGLVTHTLDNDNYFTKYVYDNQNRVSAVYKETSKGVFKVKEYAYNKSRAY